MKKAFLFLSLVLHTVTGFACSMEVDQNYLKNFLVAHAASFHEISLTSVTGIAVLDFDLNYEGGSGGGDCPDYMISTARVTFKHSPTVVKNCSYSIVVTEKTYIGNELPTSGIQDVTYTNKVVTCSPKIPGRIIIRPTH